MITVGVSAWFHDAAAAVVVDGKLVAAAAEERFSRQKHDPAFPQHAVTRCLSQVGLSMDDVDRVMFYEEPHTKFTRVLASTVAGFPLSIRPFVGAMKEWIGGKLFARNEISRILDIHPRRIGFANHHQSHAAHALLTSPYEDAAVLCVDAVGEWACTSIWNLNRQDTNPTPLDVIDYPHSLGLVFASFTAWLGLTPNSDEASTMALAAFGTPKFEEEIRQIVRLSGDGLYEVDQSYFDFLSNKLPVSGKFLDRFGPPAERGRLNAFDCFSGADPARSPTVPDALQHYADVAASIQKVTEDTLLGLARRAHEQTGSKRLCLAGGVALNCVAVARLVAEGPFESVYVPPDPGDAGGAVGAALLGARALGDQVPIHAGFSTPYLGTDCNMSGFVDMIGAITPHTWTETASNIPAERHPVGVDVVEISDEQALCDRVVDLLQSGARVGWVQGRFEGGPRALGNRSLLFDPRSLDTARETSKRIKLRAPYRPYAFSVAESGAAGVLEGDLTRSPELLRRMQTIAKVREDAVDSVRGAVHVDGTTRPQICTEQDNPRFHRLLQTWGQATGSPCLLNTSLNERGIPMVASPVEALAMFTRTDMDALVVDHAVIVKRWS